VVGRFVRIRPGEDINPFNARLFIPAVPVLMAHARQIEEELRHQLELERMRDERERERLGEQPELPLREPTGAGEAVFDSAIYRGDALTAAEHQAAEHHCRTYGLPLSYAANVARMLREQAGQPAPAAAAAAEPAPVPRHRLEKSLRQEIDRLAGKLSYRASIDKREVNYRIRSAGFPTRNRCTVEQLEQLRDWLVRSLGAL
jgi:hypothetical protein